MTRRTDYLTAEKISRALLMRDKFGPDAAFNAALSEGVQTELAASVLMRQVARIEFIATGKGLDRRQRERTPS